jgi:hypothetical protein
MADDLKTLLAESPIAEHFTPYLDYSEQADALNFYFRPEADYSKRLTDHITLFLSIDKNEIVGCRIKGVKAILEDLPNYFHLSHEGVDLSVLFWSFRGGAKDQEVRSTVNQLARAASGMKLAKSP